MPPAQDPGQPAQDLYQSINLVSLYFYTYREHFRGVWDCCIESSVSKLLQRKVFLIFCKYNHDENHSVKRAKSCALSYKLLNNKINLLC